LDSSQYNGRDCGVWPRKGLIIMATTRAASASDLLQRAVAELESIDRDEAETIRFKAAKLITGADAPEENQKLGYLAARRNDLRRLTDGPPGEPWNGLRGRAEIERREQLKADLDEQFRLRREHHEALKRRPLSSNRLRTSTLASRPNIFT
jgi:hypothetical protein